MPVAPQAEVEAQIAPYASRLVAIVEGAWQGSSQKTENKAR